MDSFLIALNAVMPTFLLLAFGYFLRNAHFVDGAYLKKTNALTFKFFLPVLLFNNIYKTQIAEVSASAACWCCSAFCASSCRALCASRGSAAWSFRAFSEAIM